MDTQSYASSAKSGKDETNKKEIKKEKQLINV